MRGKHNLKGPLFLAYAGDIVYSKIDVRNGAIGIMPAAMPVATVTSEFPVYRIRREVAIPEYIHIVIRTRHFRDIINSMVSGASGRRRVQPDELEAVELPVPSLQEQEAIVERWHKAQTRTHEARVRVANRKAAIDTRFFDNLGLEQPVAETIPKAFAVQWRDVTRWGVTSNVLKLTALDLSRGSYPAVELRSLVDLIQYGTSERANTVRDGVAVIRMNNVVDGELNLTDIKSVRLPQREIEKLLLQDGDLLFNRTNSKELVGKCAVFHAKGEFVFASYLIRVRVNVAEVEPDFLAYVINSWIGRQQIDAVSRPIIGQANVNSDELRGLRIPLPPLATQQRIMHEVSEGRAAIARERSRTVDLARAVESDIEDLIVGARKLGEL